MKMAVHISLAAIVCMIFTTPDKWSSRARAVSVTWATRCPFPVFFYSGSGVSGDHEIRRANNTVALHVPEGRHTLTEKTLAGLRYSLHKYANVADWFMKADDDTYVIWENLEYLLDDYKRRRMNERYIGRKIFNLLPHGYTSGGGGYLISKQAVELLLEEGPKTSECPQSGGVEDHDIGKCLAYFGIHPANTVDAVGRLRFHSDNPLRLLSDDASLTPFYHVNMSGIVFGNPESTDEMLSRLSITFHYVTPAEMLMFDYLLYRVQRAGRPSFQFVAFRQRLSTLLPLSTPTPTASSSASNTSIRPAA